MMGTSFKMLGANSSEGILQTATENPFLGLLVGILATSLVQSSSTVTAMIVAIVASGTLGVGAAVPMIMGANIGTTVTNTLVSLGNVTHNHEFRRAFAAATVHDLFNLFSVAILFPLEITTHFIEKTATYAASLIYGAEGVNFSSPVKVITKPVINGFKEGLSHLSSSDTIIAWLLLGISVVLLFGCLVLLTKTLKSLMLDKLELLFDRLIGKSALVGMGLGVVMTVLVQSSSITTSILVPMAGAGIINIRQIFSVTLGANVGTTITALLATLGTTEMAGAALTIALCHLFFNITGIVLIYPIKKIRNIPINTAERLAELAVKSKKLVVLYILGVFFLIPGLIVYITL